jgi:hypothetical protein
VLYGKEGVSLTTSKEVSRAAELARWIVVDSKLHPANRDNLVMSNLLMGGYEDPTTLVGWEGGQAAPGAGGRPASVSGAPVEPQCACGQCARRR